MSNRTSGRSSDRNLDREERTASGRLSYREQAALETAQIQKMLEEEERRIQEERRKQYIAEQARLIEQ